jgi:enoyl-CoA hydratase/carnithine racemase
MIFTGRIVSGDEALRIGLATRLADDPRVAALALAHEIAGASPDVVRIAKRLVDLAGTGTLDDGLRAEHALTEGIIGSRNQLEAVRANLEGREAEYRD